MTTTKTTTKRGRPKGSGTKLPSKAKSTPRSLTVKAEEPVTLPSNPFVHEILELTSKQTTNAKKVEVLRNYEHDALKSILKWNFDPGIVSLLPTGEVPYGDAEDQSMYSGSLSENIAREAAGGEAATGQDLDGRGKTSLRREWKNLYLYVKGGNDKLSKTRREMMFINLLRALHPREAEVLILVKDKDLDTKYKVTWSNVKQAFPKMTWSV